MHTPPPLPSDIARSFLISWQPKMKGFCLQFKNASCKQRISDKADNVDKKCSSSTYFG